MGRLPAWWCDLPFLSYRTAVSYAMFRSLLFLLPIVAIFLTHYVSANLYAAICAPLSVEGLLLSVFTTSSPVCNALLLTLNYTSSNYGLLMGGLVAMGIGALTNLFAKPTAVPVEPTPA